MAQHRPRKRFGQNFLQDSSVIFEILDAVNAQDGDKIVEIGPGTGALTGALLSQCRQLDVIEIDRDLAADLKRKFSDFSHFRIHCQDVLKVNFSEFQQSNQKIRVVGNLPYNISTPLLFHLLDQQQAYIQDMHFMLQKEVVERICANPGSKVFGKLSIMMQFYCQPEKLFDVMPKSFNPAPKVSSAFVRLSPRSSPKYTVDNMDTFQSLVKQAFSQRRKTLKNALKGFLSADDIASVGVDPLARAETLSIEDYTCLSDLYMKKG